MAVSPESPTVSVVIPCYNTHAHLADTIDSLRRQTFRDLEIVVVDDGSTDPATLACLERLGPDVRVHRQANRGLPGARNAGFAAARGAYVLPLDADDWLEPDAIDRMLDALRERSDASFAFAHLRLEGERRGVLVKHYNAFEQLFLNQLPYCLLMRRSLWERSGGYDETMRRGYEDWEFNIRLGLMGCAGVEVPAALFHYRVSAQGMLLSISNRIHGDLWAEIRGRHQEAYGAAALFRAWRIWRRSPSTYPLWLYFFWLTAARLLPRQTFATVIRLLSQFAHGARTSAGLSGQPVSS